MHRDHFILLSCSAEDGVRVHFEVSFEPIFTSVSTSEVTAVLARELALPAIYFSNLTAILDTLHIEVCIINT